MLFNPEINLEKYSIDQNINTQLLSKIGVWGPLVNYSGSKQPELILTKRTLFKGYKFFIQTQDGVIMLKCDKDIEKFKAIVKFTNYDNLKKIKLNIIIPSNIKYQVILCFKKFKIAITVNGVYAGEYRDSYHISEDTNNLLCSIFKNISLLKIQALIPEYNTIKNETTSLFEKFGSLKDNYKLLTEYFCLVSFHNFFSHEQNMLDDYLCYFTNCYRDSLVNIINSYDEKDYEKKHLDYWFLFGYYSEIAFTRQAFWLSYCNNQNNIKSPSWPAAQIGRVCIDIDSSYRKNVGFIRDERRKREHAWAEADKKLVPKIKKIISLIS